ncbi:tyrosine-type recombinase/integrase [Planctomycetota bacterium]
MASIFKRKRKVKLASGKIIAKQSAKWHVKYVDADGIERRVPAYKDKTASQQLAARLEKEAELAREGVVDRYKEHRKRPLAEHLEDFQQSLLAKGNTEKHAKQVVSRTRRILEGCKFIYWPDIQASKTQRFLADLQKSGSISPQTFNHYLKAVKEFAGWMVQDGRASESPLKHLKCRAVQKVVDEVHPRRALQVDELRQLFETTKSGPMRFGMSGFERYLCYRVAAETGLRAKELRSLKVNSFDLKACTVQVSGKFTKNRHEAISPLRPDTAEELRQLISGKMPQVQVFKVPEKAYKMIQADLADAHIPYVFDGLYFDFHALRHQTGTLLAASGVHPKVAQSILRHSDVNLTL